MYDTYAYSSFEHIYRNIALRSSGSDFAAVGRESLLECFLNI